MEENRKRLGKKRNVQDIRMWRKWWWPQEILEFLNSHWKKSDWTVSGAGPGQGSSIITFVIAKKGKSTVE